MNTEKQVSAGVCSWSLRAQTADELADRVTACGLTAVQLALDPVRTGVMPLAELRTAFDRAGIRILSGMMAMEGEDYATLSSIRRTGGIVPDATWPANRAAAIANAQLARELGITLVTYHAGFVPHEPGRDREVLTGRLQELAGIFAEHGVTTALETGQEGADTLAALLDDLGGSIGVNFDPANMVLYGMGDPVEAAARVAPHIRQVHIKDAISSEADGEWGEEVRAGDGFVDWQAFFTTLREQGVECDLVIEREAGDDRIADIRAAVALLMRGGL